MAGALVCLSDSAAATRIIDDAHRAAGWIMIENGFDAELSKVVKSQFDDLVERLKRRSARYGVIWDDDLLGLVEDQEKQMIEFLVNDLFLWGKAEIKARKQSGVPVVTVDMAVDSIKKSIDALFDRMWNHIRNHNLIDLNDPGQNRAVFYLERLQEDVTLYVTQLIRCWK